MSLGPRMKSNRCECGGMVSCRICRVPVEHGYAVMSSAQMGDAH